MRVLHPQVPAGHSLTTAVNTLINRDVEHSTANQCWSSEDQLTDWRIGLGDTRADGNINPPSDITLTYYATYLSTVRCVAPGTIANKLSGIQWAWSKSGFPCVVRDKNSNTHPLLSRCLKGIRRSHATEEKFRFDITVPRLGAMLSILSQANPELSAVEVTCYKSVLTNGVYNMCRVSEMSANSTTFVDKARRVLGRDVTLKDSECGYKIRHSKTMCKFRQTVTVTAHANGTATCPVAHMSAWLQVRRLGPDDPMCHHDDGSYVTRDRIAKVIFKCLSHLGWDPKGYDTHSMRSGGCLSALASGSGMTIATLKILGRWSEGSQVHWRYLKSMPAGQLARVHANMGNLRAGDVTGNHRAEFRTRFD
jgi:hypothetical protein